MNTSGDSTARSQLEVNFNRKITLLVMLFFPILISLGVWQLHRADEKRAMQSAYEQQQVLPPVTLTKTDLVSLPDYRRVMVRGTFDNDHTWLLDNKQRQGLVGYEVVSPFKLSEDGWILINRGWIAAEERRSELPSVESIVQPVTIFAEMASVVEHPMLSAESAVPGWPKVVMAIDVNVMSRQLGEHLDARYLRLDDASAGALVTQWQPINMSPEKHLGYAVQWFAMAAALLIWFVYANTNLFLLLGKRR